jgi:hypothetical protein
VSANAASIFTLKIFMSECDTKRIGFEDTFN